MFRKEEVDLDAPEHVVNKKINWEIFAGKCLHEENATLSSHHAAGINRSRMADGHGHAECLQAVERLSLAHVVVVVVAAVGGVAII